jgi:hypothetical protein
MLVGFRELALRFARQLGAMLITSHKPTSQYLCLYGRQPRITSELPAIHHEPSHSRRAKFPEAWRNLVHIEVLPDDELSRVPQSDLSLQHIG